MLITPTVERLIDLALEEDLATGDVTTELLVLPELEGTAQVLAKEDMVVAGMPLFHRLFQRMDPTVEMAYTVREGQEVLAGTELARLSGSLRVLLAVERTALNFLQRLCGVATWTRAFIRAVDGQVRITDTRKTVPGWRALDKYAARVGGAVNHRFALDGGVLIKDNHIAAAGSIGQAIDSARAGAPHLLRIEVEVTSQEELAEALAHRADIILLDNMSEKEIRQAVATTDGRALLEISGGVTLERLPALAQTGVDLISIGALTHSARAVDISLDILPPQP